MSAQRSPPGIVNRTAARLDRPPNAGRLGPANGGWLEVFNRALGQGKRAYVANDFNGDTHADILWRNLSNGSLVMWFMNGFAKTAQTVATVPLVWGVEE